jgi:uncharacterized membrane protein YfbV (UPF0208 family)
MRVCIVCGAMQSITDLDKRLNTHLEGKIHVGYKKIRALLQELKQEMEEVRVKNVHLKNITPELRNRENKTSRAMTDKADGGWRGYFSSSIMGTGVNMS